MQDNLEMKLYFNFNNRNHLHLLDVTVPTPFMTEDPPRKTGQHLKQIDLLKETIILTVKLLLAQ